jgi:hypothetical protein
MPAGESCSLFVEYETCWWESDPSLILLPSYKKGFAYFIHLVHNIYLIINTLSTHICKFMLTDVAVNFNVDTTC